MKSSRGMVALLAGVVFGTATIAERAHSRSATFDNPRTGKGNFVDRCYAWASGCDDNNNPNPTAKPAANAFCKQKGYQRATDSRWSYKAPTEILSSGQICPDPRGCGGLDFVTCESTTESAPVACGGGGKLALIAGAVLLGAPPVPGAVAAPTASSPPPVYPPPLTKGSNPLPHDLNHLNNTAPTVSGKQYVDWLKSIEALNPGKSRGQIIAAIHARSHQGMDMGRSLPGTDMKLFAHGPESDGWKGVTFPTRNNPVFVTGAQGEKIDISHTIAGLRADLNRPERVIAIGCAQFMRWANTDGGDSWQVMFQGMDRAPPDQRAGNALGIKASDFYRDPTTREILLSKFFEAEFPK